MDTEFRAGLRDQRFTLCPARAAMIASAVPQFPAPMIAICFI
jgi:hypothetical protein